MNIMEEMFTRQLKTGIAGINEGVQAFLFTPTFIRKASKGELDARGDKMTYIGRSVGVSLDLFAAEYIVDSINKNDYIPLIALGVLQGASLVYEGVRSAISWYKSK